MATSEVKQESSIPVEGRVSIITLAEMDMYFASKGITVPNRSQLVAWTIQLMRDTLLANGTLPLEVKTVAEGYNYLISRGLWNPHSRGMKKVMNALAMENLRAEGVDPESVAGPQYRTVHNAHSVKPLPDAPISELTKKALETYNNLYGDGAVKQDIKEQLERHKVAAKESGHMVELPSDGMDEETAARQAKKDAEQLKAMDEAELNPKGTVKLDKEEDDG